MTLVIKYGVPVVLINALLLNTPLPAQAASTGLNFNATANIKAGTCYFDTTDLNFDFGEVYPGSIASSTQTSRPFADADKEVQTTSDTASQDYADRYLGCDASTVAMTFNIDSEGRSAMGADGDNILTLFQPAGSTDELASGFGIAVYKMDGTTEVPVGVDTNTAMGAPGGFKLRARLVPLQGKNAADITGGLINARAILKITYQ